MRQTLMETPEPVSGKCRGLHQIVLSVAVAVYRIAQVSPERLHVANADVLKTSP